MTPHMTESVLRWKNGTARVLSRTKQTNEPDHRCTIILQPEQLASANLRGVSLEIWRPKDTMRQLIGWCQREASVKIQSIVSLLQTAERSIETSDWLVAVRSLRCHPIDFIANSSLPVPSFRSVQNANGASGLSLFVGISLSLPMGLQQDCFV